MTGGLGYRFVGRSAELDTLRAELESALGGEGRLVVLLGEPGIGKTRTATAIAAEARARGAAVAWGRCHEASGAPAYWPWVQALGSYAAEQAGERQEIEALLPLLSGKVGLSEARDVPERARFELFYRVVTALTAATRAQPLLFAFDDLHWADIGSLLLLEFVARELPSIPLLVVGTARDAELAQRVGSTARLAALLRLGRSLPLSGLARSDVSDLLSDRLGRAPEDAVIDEVLDLSDGNPFFVIEMLHLLAADDDAGQPRRGRLALPPGIRELLRQRLEPLPERTRGLLEVAAVVGRDFDVGPLAAVLGEPVDGIFERLAPALAAGIVREVAGTLQHYAFSHALMREAVYDALAPNRRVALHAAVGSALEAAASRGHVERAVLAHHFFAAAQGGDAGRAIRYACDAGEHALGVLAFEEAVQHFERALAAAKNADDATRLRLLAGLGEAVHGAGDPARAEAVFRDAVDVARRCGSLAFTETVLRCSAVRAEFGLTDVEMNSLLDDALDSTPPEPSALRARLMVRLAAGLCLQSGAEERRRKLADEATAMARGLDDPGTLAYVLPRRLIGLLGPDTLDERLATTDEILATKTSSLQAQLSALVFRADDLAQRGDRRGLDVVLASFEQLARTSRQPFFLWMAASFRTAMALLEGRFAEAEALASETLSLGQAVQTRTAMLYYAEQLFMIRGWQARFAEIEPFIETSVVQPGVVLAWRCTLAEFYSLSGRTAEARREFEAVATDDFTAVPRDAAWHGAMYLLAAVCSHLRDARRAAILYDLLRPFAGRIAVGWPLVIVLGPIDDCLGRLASSLERYDDAEVHFRDALAIAERMRALSWQAEIRYQWADMLLHKGGRANHVQARRSLDEAEALARSVGMTLLIGWIGEARQRTHELAAARAVGDTSRAGQDTARGTVLTLVPRNHEVPVAPSPRSGAFRRDGDVWSIVFEGRTTRMRDMLGLGHIARLMREPEREIHVLDLAGGPDSSSPPSPSGDAGEALDAQARAKYQARAREAREELAEAERLNDRGRVELLTEEIEFLAGELSRAFGLGGRSRRMNATGERARVAVTRAIKYAVDRLAEHDQALAEHLRLAVRTGTFCSYSPPARDRIGWKL